MHTSRDNKRCQGWPWVLRFLLVLGLLWLAGCSAAQPPKIPMDTLRYAYADTQRSCCLMVFLPGRRDSAGQYERAHFLDVVRQAGVPVDMLAVEAHYGYYANRTVVVRLREDVITPALAQGYQQIWLVGVSMGGLGALLYLRDYPDDIAGIVALAPFLGEANIVQEIHDAGGLWQWQPSGISADDFPSDLWHGLKTSLQRHDAAPRLYLGYGQQDRFAPANAFLAKYLPATQVLATPGGHNWSTWRTLWQTLLPAVSRHITP